VAHLAKVLVAGRKARAAEMRTSHVSASYRVARKSAAMSAMPAEVMPAAVVPLKTVTSAVASASPVTAAFAAALGDCVARQRNGKENRHNSNRPFGHGTLPAVTPLTSRRKR
jgi:hypothetical protein